MINCRYIDICRFCYLQDHHNRENERLISCEIMASTTTANIISGLIESAGSCCIPLHITDDAIALAIEKEFTEFDTNFIKNIDDLEQTYIYACLTW